MSPSSCQASGLETGTRGRARKDQAAMGQDQDAAAIVADVDVLPSFSSK